MIAFFVALLAVCLIAEVISLKHSTDGIEYDCRLSKSIVETDEELDLISIITNRSRRIVTFLRLGENVPADLDCGTELEVGSVTEKRSFLRSTVYLMPRQRLTRRTTFHMPRRGRYLFTGAELGGGDFLGLSERGRTVTAERELIVLPKPLEGNILETLPGGLLGDRSVNRFIHEDPMLTMGFREYTGREPMKLISWTQTARTGELMVKNLDHTTERTATVLLNLDTFAFGNYGNELIERAYSMARGVCEALEEERIPYSFLTNAAFDGGDITGEVSDGLGGAHLQPILEALGRGTYERRDNVWSLVDRAAMTGDAGRSCILITPMRQDLETAELSRVRERTGIEPQVLVVMEVYP